MIGSIKKLLIREIPFLVLLSLLLSIPSAYGVDHKIPITEFIGSIIIAIFYSIIIVGLSKIVGKWFLWLSSLVLFILFLVETVSFFLFGSRISTTVLAIILQTNASETLEFFKAHMTNIIILVIPSLLIIGGYVLIYRKWIKRAQSSTIIFPTKLFFIGFGAYLMIATIFTIIAKKKNYEIPLDKTSIHELISSFYTIQNNHKDLDSILSAINKIQIQPTNNDSTIVVLVIGESFIKYHSSLYGYNIKTNPRLEKMQKEGNLFVFNNVVTPFQVTSDVLKYLFSLKSYNDSTEWKNNALFPAVFKRAGYNVGYFDNQYVRETIINDWDFSCSYFMNPENISKECFSYRNDTTFQYDGDFVDYYKNHFIYKPKSLNIIHLLGQHVDASFRYPHDTKYKQFMKTNYKRKELKESELNRVIDYDNATYYNDLVIDKIIKLFVDKNAVLVYLTDHGELVYDGPQKVYGRKADGRKTNEGIKCINEIPFVIWCSDLYIKSHQDKVEKIKKSVNRPFSNDDTAYLLFDLVDLNSNVNNQSRSVINDSFKKRDRFIGDINYDKMKPIFDKTVLLITE